MPRTEGYLFKISPNNTNEFIQLPPALECETNDEGKKTGPGRSDMKVLNERYNAEFEFTQPRRVFSGGLLTEQKTPSRAESAKAKRKNKHKQKNKP
jgi:hypothetical protein